MIVEDEPLIAMMLEDVLDMLGNIVTASVESVSRALELVERGDFDSAILDVNLSDGLSWPVADALKAKGKPFLIASGGSGEATPERHAGAPVLDKPYTIDGVRGALEALRAD